MDCSRLLCDGLDSVRKGKVMSQPNSQMPFLPFPLMQMMGGNMQPQGPHEEEPARVRVAVELLNALTFKTMDRAAVNDVSVEVLEGQKLTHYEALLQSSACDFLRDYISGKYKLDSREKIAESLKYASVMDGPGTFIRCFACSPGPASPKCPFCHGVGTVIVYPGNGDIPS